MARDLSEWSIAELASAAADNARAQMLVGCNLLRIADQWALKHPGDGLPLEIKLDNGADQRRLVVGGDGTPDVAEGAAADLALESRMSVGQALALITDALDLHFRFPCLWARVEAGSVADWQARRIAQKTRRLSQEQAGSIDRCIAGHLANLSLTRLDNLLDAEILRVDQEARDKAAKKALAERDVRFGKPNQDNLTEFWGAMPADDAQRSDAAINQLATILQARKDYLPAGVPVRGADTRQAWRSVAMALFTTNPILANQLLLQHQQPDLFDQLFDDRFPDAHDPAGAKVVDDRPDPVHERLVAEVVGRIDASKLIPSGTLHIHLNADAFTRPENSIARLEKIGPALLSTIKTWLGDGCTIRLQPVLDPATIAPVDRYEVPDRMREAILARTPASSFPWTGSLNRRNDLDHTLPYLPPPAGPPGQTGLHNLGPLTRREHRAKTIGHMSLRQPDPGTYVWKSRYGRVLITNDSGTHDLGNITTNQLASEIWYAADRMQHLHALDVA
ncbi:hypothetical protein GCM10011575_05170 [Microlunatus endophyticus]|uniref:DUF222 domain-containing protein n=1 Tax=Microlunatus endophyticus TaxID=1716077 RepID=A0A917VZZ0_9ACTN|nr:DUF222 domain-containing protein [Microlunatus endophyticus]GGL49945.1 hypothetical protein GCM10011575_05170 [Microlunatus endophyticus]